MLKWLARALGFDSNPAAARRAFAWQAQAPDPVQRGSAAAALGGIPEPWACELLLRMLKDLLPDVRAAAGDALRRQGNAATAVLIRAVEDADPKVAVPAAGLLGELKDLDAVRPLLLVMKFGSPEVRAAATRALIAYGRAAIPGILLACEDPDPWTRTAARRS